jgi:hypothetical protein
MANAKTPSKTISKARSKTGAKPTKAASAKASPKRAAGRPHAKKTANAAPTPPTKASPKPAPKSAASARSAPGEIRLELVGTAKHPDKDKSIAPPKAAVAALTAGYKPPHLIHQTRNAFWVVRADPATGKAALMPQFRLRVWEPSGKTTTMQDAFSTGFRPGFDWVRRKAIVGGEQGAVWELDLDTGASQALKLEGRLREEEEFPISHYLDGGRVLLGAYAPAGKRLFVCERNNDTLKPRYVHELVGGVDVVEGRFLVGGSEELIVLELGQADSRTLPAPRVRIERVVQLVDGAIRVYTPEGTFELRGLPT